jgi:hypothetical protein
MKIQTHLTKKAGHDVPVELLAVILNRPVTAYGFAVQDATGDKAELAVKRESGKPTMSALNEFQRLAHDFSAMLWFGELGSKFNKEDCGPLTIEDGDGKPFLALGIEGDFAKYADPASGRTDEYNYAQKILIPSLIDILNVTGGDWDQIVERINSDRFNNSDILPHISHRGVVTLFPLTGDPVWLGKNELGEAYEWGQISNRHGFGDVKQEPTPKVEAKKGFSFGGLMGKKEATASPSPSPSPAEPVESKTSVPEVRSDGKDLPVPIKLPDWVHKNDDKKTWYLMVAGQVPDNWKRGVPVIPTLPLDELPKDLGDLKIFEARRFKEQKAHAQASPVVANKEAIGPAKTETSAGAPKTGGEIAAQRAEENRPIIAPAEMEKILDFAAKVEVKDTMSVAEMQALEKKIGFFSSNIGMKPVELINWPASAWFFLAEKHPKAIVQALLEFRGLYRDTLKLEDLAGSTVKTTTTDLGNGSKKVESVDTKPVVEKKPGFSFGKKVA